MTATQLITSSISTKSLASFEGLRPSSLKFTQSHTLYVSPSRIRSSAATHHLTISLRRTLYTLATTTSHNFTPTIDSLQSLCVWGIELRLGFRIGGSGQEKDAGLDDFNFNLDDFDFNASSILGISKLQFRIGRQIPIPKIFDSEFDMPFSVRYPIPNQPYTRTAN